MRKTALACCFLFILSFMQIHALMNYEVIQTEELGLGDRFTVFRIFSDINEPVTYADARRIVLKKQNRVDYSEHISTRCNVIDYQGNLLSSTEFYTIGDFSNELAPAQFYANSTFGFIDETGEFAIPPKFDHAGPFCNGLAPVSVNGRWGYVDTTGEFVKLYDDPAITAYVFSDGVAWLRRPNQEAEIESYFYTLIDTQFHELFTIEARSTVPFNEGISCVKMFDLTPDGKPFYYVRIINKQGTTLFRVDEPNTYAYTRIKNGYIYSANQSLDLNGTPMPSSLKGINWMEMFGDGVFTARREGELLLFDQAGNILKTLPSERVHSLSHGLSYLTFSYKWYHYLIFDNQCQTKEVLPPVYSRHLPFPQKTAGPERCVALRPGWGTALVGDEFRLIERPVSREVTPLLMDGWTDYGSYSLFGGKPSEL